MLAQRIVSDGIADGLRMTMSDNPSCVAERLCYDSRALGLGIEIA
jgi:hypothetical protein